MVDRKSTNGLLHKEKCRSHRPSHFSVSGLKTLIRRSLASLKPAHGYWPVKANIHHDETDERLAPLSLFDVHDLLDPERNLRAQIPCQSHGPIARAKMETSGTVNPVFLADEPAAADALV